MMLIPFLNEVGELRAKMQAYFSARRAAGHDHSTARVLGVYHAYVGESSAEARAAAAPGLHEYHSAAQAAHSLTPGMADPESYRSHEKHRSAMKRLTFDELVEQNRVLVGSAEEVREKVAFVRERLYLTDMAGNFALGGLSDNQSARIDATIHGAGCAECWVTLKISATLEARLHKDGNRILIDKRKYCGIIGRPTLTGGDPWGNSDISRLFPNNRKCRAISTRSISASRSARSFPAARAW